MQYATNINSFFLISAKKTFPNFFLEHLLQSPKLMDVPTQLCQQGLSEEPGNWDIWVFFGFKIAPNKTIFLASK